MLRDARARVESRLDVQRSEPARKAEEAAARGAACPATAAGHRRAFIRASLLSCSSENNPKASSKPAGAILGFANMLLRLYRGERPRAVLVAWDTLEAPTYRHENFPAYQSGREFDDALIEQLDVLPGVALPAAFRMRKRRVSRRMIFSPPLPPKKKGEGALSSLRAATATHFSLPPTAPPSSTPSALARWRVSAPPRFVRGMASSPSRFRILSPCAAIPPTKCRAHRALARLVLRRCCKDTAASKPRLKAGRFPAQGRKFATLPISRDNEPESAAAEPSQSKANLGQLGHTRARMGAKPTRRPA